MKTSNALANRRYLHIRWYGHCFQAKNREIAYFFGDIRRPPVVVTELRLYLLKGRSSLQNNFNLRSKTPYKERFKPFTNVRNYFNFRLNFFMWPKLLILFYLNKTIFSLSENNIFSKNFKFRKFSSWSLRNSV